MIGCLGWFRSYVETGMRVVNYGVSSNRNPSPEQSLSVNRPGAYFWRTLYLYEVASILAFDILAAM